MKSFWKIYSNITKNNTTTFLKYLYVWNFERHVNFMSGFQIIQTIRESFLQYFSDISYNFNKIGVHGNICRKDFLDFNERML